MIKPITKRPALASDIEDIFCTLLPDTCDDKCKGDNTINIGGVCIRL